MDGKRHNASLWLKWTIAFIAAAIFLLIAGASPVWGAKAVYHSGLMLLLGLAVGALSLFGVFFIRWKNIGLLLLHAGSVLVLTGAFIDFAKEEKMEGTLFIGEEYVPDPAEGDAIPDFHFIVRDFNIDYYSPPVYALVDIKNKKELEEATPADGNVSFPLHHETVSLERLENAMTGPHPFLVLDENKFVYLKKRGVEKYYEADFLITDKEERREFNIAVNHPATYKGWRFYLMNHGRHENRQFVQLIVRHAPGRHWVQAGILLLILGAFQLAFTRQGKEKPKA